jgi:hypothetical protein
VTLEWPAANLATGYAVYAAQAGGVTPDTYASLPGGRRIAAAGSPLTVRGLPDGTTWHFVVTALGPGGEGIPSAEVTSTPERDCACPGWQVCDSTRSCAAPAGDGDYLVGLCFHALSDHWTVKPVRVLDDVFLPNYHRPGIRDAVRARLAGLAAAGARVIKTELWFMNDAVAGSTTYGMDFPPSPQQLRNLRDYAADVAATPTPGGAPLELYLSNGYDGSADLTRGSPQTGLGWSSLPGSQYAERMLATIDAELDAVRGLYRSDGRPAVTLVYLMTEFVTCSTADDTDQACTWPGSSQPFHNAQWFMSSFYPHFVARARAVGIIPSVYFLASGEEAHLLDRAWRDPYWTPRLDGLPSMSFVYRSLRFMRDQGLPIPERIDFTATVNGAVNYTTEATVLARIYDDLQAILPEFQSPPYRYAAAEASYYADPVLLATASKAYAAERMLGRGLEAVLPWPQFREGVPTYDFGPFETDQSVTPFAGLNPGFELPGADGLPAGWSADGAGPSLATRVDVPDAHGGTTVLRFDAGACAGCVGALSEPVGVATGQTALVRFWARSVIPQTGGRPPAPDYSGLAVEVRGSMSGVDVGPLLDFGTVDTANAWRRFVGVVPVPTGVDALRLRFWLQGTTTGIVDVDDLH